MQTVEVTLSPSQYERLDREAQRWQEPIATLIQQVIDEYLERLAAIEATQTLYSQIAQKQALWRESQPWTGPNGEAHREEMRWELIYQSERLEGSPLSKQEMRVSVERDGTE
jgi:predicted DNA-binding protein